MITTRTTFIPKGKLIQVMADVEVMESHQLEPDESAVVIIEIKKCSATQGEGQS